MEKFSLAGRKKGENDLSFIGYLILFLIQLGADALEDLVVKNSTIKCESFDSKAEVKVSRVVEVPLEDLTLLKMRV